ncbi:MAG: hypothetical protein D6746_16920 [Bacteroidetes bacterium]|nr:MAG: hypothetical protein D6746_16920 [Bacteroidota bacterium]GIV57342.1 MAG: hypothetical protein KatS3mg042_0255 [Rhodothermaceae bacterium]
MSSPHPARPSVLRNISWLTGASVLVKPLWFVFITLFCMRTLGASGYGIMTIALSFMTLAASFGDFVTNAFTIREVARARRLASRYFSNLLAARVVLLALAWLVALGVGWSLGYGTAELRAFVFAGIYAAALRLLEFCRTFYRAFEVLQYESYSIVLEKMLVVGGGLAMLWTTGTPHGTLLGMAAGMLLTLLLNVSWIHRTLARLRPRLLSLGFLRTVFWAALPLGLYALFNQFYRQIGLILLEGMEGEVAAGLFGAAFRVTEALQLLPTVVAAAVLPRLSNLFNENDAPAFQRLLRQSLLGAGLLSVAAAATVMLFGPTIIRLLDPSPEFAPAGPLLQVVIWTFPLMTLNNLVIATLTAVGQYRFLAWLFGFIVLVNPLLNVLLVPHLAYYGTAIALLGSEACILAASSLQYHFATRDWRAAAIPTREA